jgi:hypothetical protein
MRKASKRELIASQARGAGHAPRNAISDCNFISDLERLKALRLFVIKGVKSIGAEESNLLDFGPLEPLYLSNDDGRVPTTEEWNKVEHVTQSLLNLLPQEMRKRFLVENNEETPSILATYGQYLGIAAVVSLISAMFIQYVTFRIHGVAVNTGVQIFIFYCLWLMTMGALGSIAFMGMNALSVQEDITFDLSNRHMIRLRIIVGAMLALTISVWFGFNGFYAFCNAVSTFDPNTPNTAQTQINFSTGAAMLSLPFVLGYSTSLVILILNRFVVGAQSFFGRGVDDAFGRTRNNTKARIRN